MSETPKRDKPVINKDHQELLKRLAIRSENSSIKVPDPEYKGPQTENEYFRLSRDKAFQRLKEENDFYFSDREGGYDVGAESSANNSTASLNRLPPNPRPSVVDNLKFSSKVIYVYMCMYLYV